MKNLLIAILPATVCSVSVKTETSTLLEKDGKLEDAQNLAQYNVRNAPDGKAIFYRHDWYGGDYLTYGVNQFNRRPWGYWDNTISSVKIGKGVKAILCDKPNCEGYPGYRSATEIIGPLNVADLGSFSDKISHIRLVSYTGGEATVFEEPYFSGYSRVFSPGHYRDHWF